MKLIIIKLFTSNVFVRVYGGFSHLCSYMLWLLSLTRTRCIFPNSRGLMLDLTVDVKYSKNITFGSNVVVGKNCLLGAMATIKIGDYVRMSKGVTVETATLDIRGVLPYKHKASPIVIGDGVWLGTDCIVLGGVNIGENSVIGAGVVVARDVPPNSVVVNQPARIIERLK